MIKITIEKADGSTVIKQVNQFALISLTGEMYNSMGECSAELLCFASVKTAKMAMKSME